MFRPTAWLSILLALSGGIIFSTGLFAGILSDQLISAAELGEIDKVKGLLDQGVPVEARNEDGWTALMKATYEGHGEIVRELIAKGAGVEGILGQGTRVLFFRTQANQHALAFAFKRRFGEIRMGQYLLQRLQSLLELGYL